MHNTTGLNSFFLLECFLENYKLQLRIATTEKAKKFLKSQIASLQTTLQTFYN